MARRERAGDAILGSVLSVSAAAPCPAAGPPGRRFRRLGAQGTSVLGLPPGSCTKGKQLLDTLSCRGQIYLPASPTRDRSQGCYREAGEAWLDLELQLCPSYVWPPLLPGLTWNISRDCRSEMKGRWPGGTLFSPLREGKI